MSCIFLKNVVKIFSYDKLSYDINDYLEASRPKLVNPISNKIRINSLRLGGLHLTYDKRLKIVKTGFFI